MSPRVGRRSFVVTSLASGFALAVSPASAQAVTTSAEGLEASEVKIGAMPAYRAAPHGNARLPLVLVVSEIFGVHEHIKDVCRRLARAGYMAVAPELFAREGDVSKLTDIAQVLEVVAKVPDEQVMRDLDATADWAKKTGRVDDKRVAVTGFCWGGRVVWLYCARTPGLKAGAAWYGRISNAVNALQTTSPLDVATKLKAPVLGLYGGKDSGIPVAHVELMKKELAAGGPPSKASEVVVYPDAGHAFNADYRPSYHKASADDAWAKMLAWFKKNGA
jgi:carboxymethylenebutenolidase